MLSSVNASRKTVCPIEVGPTRREVTLGEDTNLWCHAAIRGDVAPITIGARCNLQDGVIVHCDHDVPQVIGDDVSMGHGAIVHGVSDIDLQEPFRQDSLAGRLCGFVTLYRHFDRKGQLADYIDMDSTGGSSSPGAGEQDGV